MRGEFWGEYTNNYVVATHTHLQEQLLEEVLRDLVHVHGLQQPLH